MKRSWMGFGLLIVLLLLALGVTWVMARIHEPAAQDLEQAAQYALQGDWANAEHFSRYAREKWDEWAHFRTCFADHTPVEDIDAAFAALEVYAAARDEVAFAASCMELARKIEAVGEVHDLVWWNVM